MIGRVTVERWPSEGRSDFAQSIRSPFPGLYFRLYFALQDFTEMRMWPNGHTLFAR